MTSARATSLEDERSEVLELATKGTAIGARIDGLETAVEAARGRLDEALLTEVDTTVKRSAGRLRLSAHHTVVAIAGATGSGKSSTFNALTGLELSAIGVRRPTTSWATACVWGSEGAEEVLEWLGIPARHQTMRDSLLDKSLDDTALEGVVLMDLPDHDSTELAHHLEVDRLVELADVLVWVLDPQKYADAAIHERYFAPYATHQDVMVVALNHIDTIPEERREGVIADVRRLLAIDGLPDVKAIPISARAGIGMADLRAEIAGRVAAKRSTTARVEADIAAVAQQLAEESGSAAPRELNPRRIEELEEQLAEAAGVPSVVAGVERSVRSRATRAVTWPPLALLRPLRQSPGKRLDVDLGDDLQVLGGRDRRALPAVAPVQRALVDSEVRRFGDEAADGLSGGWGRAVRHAATGRLSEVDDRLDAGLSGVDLGGRLPTWVRLAQVLHWLLLLGALGAGGWWVYLLATGGDVPSTPGVDALPLPAVLLGLGLLLGFVLWLVARGAASGLAGERATAAEDALHGVVAQVVRDDVAGPVSTELAAYGKFRGGVAAAQDQG